MCRFLQPYLSQEPSAQLIRQTARNEWRLIALNLCSSLVLAFSEGATLGVVFMAVGMLSAPPGQPFNWMTNSIVGRLPALAAWLNSQSSTAVFFCLLAIAVLLQALQSLTRFLNLVSSAYFAARCRALVTGRIHSQVMRMSFPCASQYKVGDLTLHAGQGPVALFDQIELSGRLLVGLLLCGVYLAVLMRISPWLLIAVLLIGMLTTLVQKKLLPSIQQGARAVNEAELMINTRITENFQALRLLHSSGQLDVADQQVISSMNQLKRALQGQALRMSVVGPFSTFLPTLAIALITALSLLLFGGRSTGVLPSLVTFVLALQRLSGHVTGIAAAFNTLADNSTRLARLNQILSPARKQFRRKGGQTFRYLGDQISFEDVALQYAPELPPALTEISFVIPKGNMVALVGPSGAGKSSIADLLTGLYDPSAGRILIDGSPLQELDLVGWQKCLGVVSQDTFLFNASIAENIAFGTPGATLAQIKEACLAAQAAGFIEKLPQGYSTLVGERGYRLSGGQRQRLSLARAILRDPDLLILDEATSALDSQSERHLQEAIERFEGEHTLLVIAHRLSTIVRADQILVLDHGRIVQRGSHRDLLCEVGLYKDLWEQQTNADLAHT